jgi:hypothetical protein
MNSLQRNFERKGYTHLAENENGVLYERPIGLNPCAQPGIEISGGVRVSVRQDVRMGSWSRTAIP